MEILNAFLYGTLTALAFVAGLFFVRYWRRTRERFFVFVAITFWCLAGHWASLGCGGGDGGTAEHAAYFYVPRLVAFTIMIAGIIDKNRRGAHESS